MQTGACSEDIAANIARMLHEFRSEADRGTDLVVFPELATAPYFCATTHDDRFWDWAEPIPGPTTDAFAKVAADTGTAVCLGLYERGADGSYFNTAPLIDATGQLVAGRRPDGTSQAAYRKLAIPCVTSPTLTTDEKHWYGPGPSPCIFELDGVRIAILVCYDRSFSEHWLAAGHLGADIVIVPLSSFGWRAELFTPELRLRAMEIGTWVVAANRVGPETVNGQTLDFFGLSCAIEPSGRVVAQAATHQPQVVRATLDLGFNALARTAWPMQHDRRPELYRFMYDGTGADA